MLKELASSATIIITTVTFAAGASKLATRTRKLSHTALASLLKSNLATKAAWLVIGASEILIAASIFLIRDSRLPLWAISGSFVLAGTYLLWALVRYPGQSCGCFGAGHESPVSFSELLRAGGLAGLAGFALFFGGVWPAADAPARVWVLGMAGLCLIALISPELRTAKVSRLRGRSWPNRDCLKSPLPVELALRTLHESDVWRELKGFIKRNEYSDDWRVGCWRLFAFEAETGSMPTTAIFAVRIVRRREAVAGAVVCNETEEILLQKASGSFDSAVDHTQFPLVAESAA